MQLSFTISMQETGFESVGQGDWKAIMQYTQQVGFEGVELAIRDPAKVDTSELREVLSRTGLRLVAIGTGQAYYDHGFSLIADDEHVRLKTVQVLENHIELARHFGAMVIIGLIRGKLKEQRDQRKAYSYFEENMIKIDSYAQQLGVDLVIEPLNRYETDYLNTVEQTVNLMEANGLKHTGILLDTFHMNIEEPKWDQSIHVAAKYLKHVHIADSNRMCPGRGHIKFEEIVSMIKEIGYESFFSGEMLPVPDLKTAIRGYYNYMRNLP